jgi:hypothetical protein
MTQVDENKPTSGVATRRRSTGGPSTPMPWACRPSSKASRSGTGSLQAKVARGAGGGKAVRFSTSALSRSP